MSKRVAEDEHQETLQRIGLEDVTSDFNANCVNNAITEEDISEEEIPFKDAITLDPLRKDDVILVDGQCFSKKALIHWINEFKPKTSRPVNPLTRRLFAWSEIEKLGFLKESFASYNAPNRQPMTSSLPPRNLWRDGHDATGSMDLRSSLALRLLSPPIHIIAGKNAGAYYVRKNGWWYKIFFISGKNSIITVVLENPRNNFSDPMEIVRDIAQMSDAIRRLHSKGGITIFGTDAQRAALYPLLHNMNSQATVQSFPVEEPNRQIQSILYPVNQS